MAKPIWRGGAPAVAQVDTFTIGGTVEVGDLFTITIGNSVYSYAAATTTVATEASAMATDLQAAIDAGTYPEFTGLTAAYTSGGAFTLTGTAGVPFTATAATTESNGGAADAQTFTKTSTTACSGPNFFSVAANWSTDAVPVDTDDPIYENSDIDCLYGLSQTGLALNSLTIKASYTGKIGLPLRNDNGYEEYLTASLSLESCTTLDIGRGDGDGSGRIKIDVGSTAACAATVHATGTSEEQADGIPAVLLTGSHASNALSVLDGTLGLAFFGGETANFPTIKCVDADLTIGSGTSTVTSLTHSGSGNVVFQTAATTINKDPQSTGKLTVIGSGAVTTLNANGGEVDYQGTGTITTLNGGPAGYVNFEPNPAARTVTNANLYRGFKLRDRSKSATWTNPIATPGCSIVDLDVDFGIGRTYAVAG